MTHQDIHRLFGSVAARHSERTAIQSGDEDITYGELERRSSALAGYLISAGARKGDIIAILGDRPVQVTTAILGILKAGCVFAPLDPLLPERRLISMLAEAPPRLFVVGPQYIKQARPLVESIQPGVDIICVGRPELNSDNQPGVSYFETESRESDSSELNVESDPDDMCYLYFTSGSTGRPKGIAGRLKAIDHFVRWEIETFHVTEEDRVSQLTSPSFDAYLRDIFTPLCSGATVCAPPSRDMILDSKKLVHWLDSQKISLIHCVPTLFRSILNANLNPDLFGSLRYVLMAGEPLLPSDVEKWMDIFEDRVQLVNMYGPSETTMVKLFYFVNRADCHKERIPIGMPMNGAAAVVVSVRGRICPPGAVGELYIRTPFRSLGYFNQPELTKEVFIQNPFNSDPEDIVYKTGDLCRLLDDGNFEFIGRKDHQVKIRGIRIELGEIEKILRSHQAVRDAVVLDREDSAGDKRLCAYIVLDQNADPGDLRERLREHLPDVMIPSFFVFLDELPRTISGKIDRKALPEPSLSGTAPAGIAAAPRNPIEEVLVSIWAQILGNREIGVLDNFFQMGGHSLLATQLLAEIRTKLGVEVPLRSLFENPTIEGLSNSIESMVQNGQRREIPPLRPVGRDIELPLSFAQQRLWFLDQIESGSAFYNISGAVCLSGKLDAQSLERALFEMTRRHEILRTTFKAADGLPRQVIATPVQSPLPILDLRALSESDREAETERIINSEANKMFDLSEGPLFRVILIRLKAEEHVVFLTMHHIISDGWSVGLFIKEVFAIYAAYCEGKQSSLPDLPIQYADFAVWQQQWLQGELIEKELTYWTRQLANAPKLKLLPKRPRPEKTSFKGAHRSFQLTDNLAVELNLLSARAGVSLFMTLLAAYGVLLNHYSDQEDIVIGAPIASRDPRETERLIGLFINLLTLRIDLSGDPSFLELLGRVREVTLDAYTHQNVPFEKLVEHLRPERLPGENPLFQVLFTLDNTPDSELQLPDLTFGNKDLTIETAQHDLVLHVVYKAGRLLGVIQYKTDLFEHDAIQMLRNFELILRQVVERPEVSIHELREALSQNDKRHWAEEGRQLETISLRRLKTISLESRKNQFPHRESVQ